MYMKFEVANSRLTQDCEANLAELAAGVAFIICGIYSGLPEDDREGFREAVRVFVVNDDSPAWDASNLTPASEETPSC